MQDEFTLKAITLTAIRWIVLPMLVVFGSLLYVVTAQAAEFWTDDKLANTLMVSANTLLIVDWAQTREIADNPVFEEIGFAENFIGSNPTTGEVNRYFVTSMVVYNTINYFLPTNWKKWYSGSVATFELSYVRDNVQLGIGMKF